MAQSLAFVIGSSHISGGIYVIYQHAMYAKAQGWDVCIIHTVPLPTPMKHWHEASKQLRFLALYEGENQVKDKVFDLVVATWSLTVYALPQIRARQYAYFVQAIESWFEPDHAYERRSRMDATYLAPLPIITEASWIAEYLTTTFGRSVRLALNGVRKDILHTGVPHLAPPSTGKLRVLVEGSLGERRKNIPRTIRLLQQIPGIEIWLLTSSPARWYPGVSKVFSQLPVHEVGAVYHSCDVLVKLSTVEGMFGPPLEMFHCGGTAIAYAIPGHEEYMRNGENSLVYSLGDEDGVVHGVMQLRDDRTLLARLQERAQRTAASWPNWEAASARFFGHLCAIMEAPPVHASEISAALSSAPKSGGDAISIALQAYLRLRKCLGKIKRSLPYADAALQQYWLPVWSHICISREKQRAMHQCECHLPKTLIARHKGNSPCQQ